MTLVFHIATRAAWEAAGAAGKYRGDTLATEGFIHCSTQEQVVRVANALFPGRQDLVLLAIDAARVTAEVRYEDGGGGEEFPHLYGPLNLDAVVGVFDFQPGADGRFALPAALAECDRDRRDRQSE